MVKRKYNLSIENVSLAACQFANTIERQLNWLGFLYSRIEYLFRLYSDYSSHLGNLGQFIFRCKFKN